MPCAEVFLQYSKPWLCNRAVPHAVLLTEYKHPSLLSFLCPKGLLQLQESSVETKRTWQWMQSINWLRLRHSASQAPSCFPFMSGMGNIVISNICGKMQVTVILKMSGSLEDNNFPIKKTLSSWKVLCWDRRWKFSMCLSQPAEWFRRNSAGIPNLAVQDLTQRHKGRKNPLCYTSSSTFKKLTYVWLLKGVTWWAEKWNWPR